MDLDDMSKEEFERIRKESQNRVAMQNTAPTLKKPEAAQPEAPEQSSVPQAATETCNENYTCVLCHNRFVKPVNKNVGCAVLLVILSGLMLPFALFTGGLSLLGIVIFIALIAVLCPQSCPHCGSTHFIKNK